jgi:2-keto-3-deoxy-L-rhamnonate aldolase RhmA
LAAKVTGATALVRIPWNEPVLDLGAAGVIVPLVRTIADVRRAVTACRYWPEGLRGYGPRRPSNYGRPAGRTSSGRRTPPSSPSPPIEPVEAVNNLDEILAVTGLTPLVIGPHDFAGSQGHPGGPRQPEVLCVIDMILAKAQKAGVPVSQGASGEPGELAGSESLTRLGIGSAVLKG